MDTPESQPQQQELLNPRPAGSDAAGHDSLQLCLDLRTLIHAALVGLIVLCMAVDLFFGKQMLLVRRQIEDQQPNFARAEIDFRRNREPQIRVFMDELHRYAATHPEFRTAILDRYRIVLAQYFSAAATASRPVPIPQGTNFNNRRPAGR
ncbi:MAG: hypothetical protein QOF48_1833 [Verrucomicrobiota bacterium]|jgi:hypothetical protein